jgi:phosphate starvation-inducible PhoH-like protein
VTHRNGKVHVSGDESAVTQATAVLERLKTLVQRQRDLAPDQVDEVLSVLRGVSPFGEQPAIEVIYAGRRINPRTPGQARYIDAIRKHDMVFAVGPAGTGKTYLAVALAVEALKNRAIRKIVLVRPAVEAGERLGFLPGDLQAKINPYLRPLLDALHEMIDHDQIKRLMEQDVIEVIPLAYMRGRTLNEAFIILDEAQNTTVAQMKMFLTRMGSGSKIVVSGDHTQVDLPHDARSGLTDALSRLKGIKGIKVIRLTAEDIVRHRLVQEIVHAYEEGPRRRRGAP